MFKTVRIKLTGWYLLIIMLVSMGFSGVIYKVQTMEFDRFSRLQRVRIERRLNGDFPPPPLNPVVFDPELIAETKQRLIVFFAAVNGGIFILAGGLAFFLAGKTLKPIKEMVDEQNQFITDASHEFKTPLTSLRSVMEVSLRDRNFNLKEAKELIKGNLEEVNKLQSLTEGLLKLTQYEKTNNGLRFEKISLKEITKKSLQKIEPLAIRKKITIKDKTKDVQFEGDPYGIGELLVILLDNSIKYSPSGKTVTISSKTTDGILLISVADEGIGVSEVDLPNIFNRFYRADMARSKEKVGGYGLGLSIAKKIIDSHHGAINVKSGLKKGSVFTVHLPKLQKQSRPFFS